jgi:hypothetical protein
VLSPLNVICWGRGAGGATVVLGDRLLEVPGVITVGAFLNPRCSAEPTDEWIYFFPDLVAGVVGFDWFDTVLSVISMCVCFSL